MTEFVGPTGRYTDTQVLAVPSTDRVAYQGQVYRVQSARVRATASGNTVLVAAVSGRQIGILSWTVGPVSAAVTVTIQDAAGTPVVLAGPFDCAANGGIVVGRRAPVLATLSTDVNVNLSAAANVTVMVEYIEV